LDAPDGTPRRSATLALPTARIRPDSVLDVRFHLVPKDFDPCALVGDQTLWATLHADTRLTLPRDRVAELPDLSRLRYRAWPFTLEPGVGATVLAVPDDPSPAEVSAGFALAAELGRQSRADAPAFRMVVASEAPPDAAADAHLVLLEGQPRHAGIASLERLGRLRVRDGALSDAAGHTLVETESDGIQATLEELLHPAHPDRALLVLRAGAPELLPVLVRALSEPEQVGQLQGDAALLDAAGRTRTVALAERREVGSRAVRAQLVDTARRHWGLLAVALLGTAFFLSSLRRAWARARSGA
jgi:hypothetical protein